MVHDIAQAVETTVQLFVANPRTDVDGIADLLKEQGMDEDLIDDLVVFIPFAFGRTVFKGLPFRDHYWLLNATTDRKVRKAFTDNEVYMAALEAAERKKTEGMNGDNFLCICAGSSEIRAMNQLLHKGSEIENIRFVEPSVFTDKDIDGEPAGLKRKAKPWWKFW